MLGNYVELEIPEEYRNEKLTAFIEGWLKDEFDPGTQPDLLLLGSSLYFALVDAYPRKEIGRSMVRFRPADDKATPWKLWGYYQQNLHPKIAELEQQVTSKENYIKDKTKVWNEAERIKRIHDGGIALEFYLTVPAKIVNMAVLNKDEIDLDDAAETALLAKVGNQQTTVQCCMRLTVPTEKFGYNHAFMEAVHHLSGPLGQQFGEQLESMVQKLIEGQRADRDTSRDTPVA